MDNKAKVATGLVGVILAHHIADVVKHPLDDGNVPAPMAVMAVSSTSANGAFTAIGNTISDERIITFRQR
jgi:hypothetical protein